jgi:hypothetical protein
MRNDLTLGFYFHNSHFHDLTSLRMHGIELDDSLIINSMLHSNNSMFYNVYNVIRPIGNFWIGLSLNLELHFPGIQISKGSRW